MAASFTSIFLFLALLLGVLSLIILIYHCFKRKYCVLPLILNVLVLSAWVFHRFLMETRLILEVPHLFRFSTPLIILSGSTAYLYVRALINTEVRWQKRDWVHLLPGLWVLVMIFPFYIRSGEEKRAWLEGLYEDPEQFGQFLEGMMPPYTMHILAGVIVFTYSILGVLLIVKYLKKTPSGQHFIPPATIRWILSHCSILIIFSITAMSVVGVEKIPMVYYGQVLSTLAGVLLFPAFLLLFFNPAILYGMTEEEYAAMKPSKALSKADSGAQYGLDAEKKEMILTKLRTYMEHSEPYLDKELNLPMLAEELKASRHQISYVINHEFNTNFNTYINGLRIEHCLQSLTKEHWRTYTLEAIADESGFGSRGTFIKAFKKKTGILPSDYRKNILSE